jgi:hypothetical protein
LTDTGEYRNLPLQIIVTRPQEKYSMRLTYKTPETVVIGHTYPQTAFVLKNSWGLDEVDLDKELTEVNMAGPTPGPTNSATTRIQ